MDLLELPFASQVIVGVGSMVFGLFLTAAWVTQRRKSAGATTWLQVPGHVLSTSVECGDSYFPRVRYEYVVEGQEHQGARLSVLERGYNFRSSAEAAAAHYKVGDSVVVWVNPNDCNDAVLIPGSSHLAAMVFIVAGVVFFGFGAWVLLVALRTSA